jgi:signal transduction histidine kinase
MREYRISARDLTMMKMNRVIWLAFSVFLLMSFLWWEYQMRGEQQSWLIALGTTGLIGFVLGGMYWFYRYKERVESLRVFLEPDRVTCLASNQPMITITRDSIRKLRVTRSGIRIYCYAKHVQMFIPKGMKDYEELEHVLKQWVYKPESKSVDPVRMRFFRWQIVIQPVE